MAHKTGEDNNRSVIDDLDGLEWTMTSTISNLSLTRPISVDDVRYSVKRGWNAGYKKGLKDAKKG